MRFSAQTVTVRNGVNGHRVITTNNTASAQISSRKDARGGTWLRTQHSTHYFAPPPPPPPSVTFARSTAGRRAPSANTVGVQIATSAASGTPWFTLPPGGCIECWASPTYYTPTEDELFAENLIVMSQQPEVCTMCRTRELLGLPLPSGYQGDGMWQGSAHGLNPAPIYSIGMGILGSTPLGLAISGFSALKASGLLSGEYGGGGGLQGGACSKASGGC